MSVKNLLKIIFDRRGCESVQQMADYSGFHTEYLRQTLHGKRIPSDDMLLDACIKMRLSEKQTKQLIIAACSDRAKKPETKEAIEKLMNTNFENIENGKPIELNTDYYRTPVYSYIKAGMGNLKDNLGEVIGEVLLTKQEYTNKCFAILLNDKSMEPDIRVGDIGVFEPLGSMQPMDGDIVAVEHQGHTDLIVKKLKIVTQNKIKLVSINEKFKTIVINPKEPGFKVRGTLLRTVREFKKRVLIL